MTFYLEVYMVEVEKVKNEWVNGIISAREAGRQLGISHTGFKKWVMRDMRENTSAKNI